MAVVIYRSRRKAARPVVIVTRQLVTDVADACTQSRYNLSQSSHTIANLLQGVICSKVAREGQDFLSDATHDRGGGGCKWKFFRLHMSFFPFRAELTTGGGGANRKFFPLAVGGVENRPPHLFFSRPGGGVETPRWGGRTPPGPPRPPPGPPRPPLAFFERQPGGVVWVIRVGPTPPTPPANHTLTYYNSILVSNYSARLKDASVPPVCLSDIVSERNVFVSKCHDIISIRFPENMK